MAAEQAALLLNRGFDAEAEQTFRVALELSPASPESVTRYVNLLEKQNRFGEAFSVTENAVKATPDNTEFQHLRADLQNKKH